MPTPKWPYVEDAGGHQLRQFTEAYRKGRWVGDGGDSVNFWRVVARARGVAIVVGVFLSAVPYGYVTGEPTQELSPGRACAPVLSGSDSSFIPDDPGRVSEWSMAVCKRRPDNPDTLVAVVPMSAETGELRDLQILVIDLPRQTVVARRVERNVLEGDAIYVNAVALDTARYALAPKQRAFGVRIRWKGSSGPNPYSRETLSLYTVSSPRIERNLAGLVTWERWGEWDMDCTGTFSSVSRTISVAPREEGDARLNVTQKTKDERMTKTPTGCATAVVREAVRRRVLSVAGGKYVVPSTMQAPGP